MKLFERGGDRTLEYRNDFNKYRQRYAFGHDGQ